MVVLGTKDLNLPQAKKCSEYKEFLFTCFRLLKCLNTGIKHFVENHILGGGLLFEGVAY